MTQSRGFTLVEVLAALAVLIVGLLPVFQMATISIRLSGPIQNALIAAHLSQEGVEVIRAMRDNAWLVGTAFGVWSNTMNTACATGCRVEYNSTAPLALGNPVPVLKRDATSGLYQYSTGSTTFFTRTIFVVKLANDEVKVVSQINWMERSVAKQVRVESYLFDWLK